MPARRERGLRWGIFLFPGSGGSWLSGRAGAIDGVCERMSPEKIQFVSTPRDAWSVIWRPEVWPWPKWNSDSGVMETKRLFSRRAFWSSSVRKGACEKITGTPVSCRPLAHSWAGAGFRSVCGFSDLSFLVTHLAPQPRSTTTPSPRHPPPRPAQAQPPPPSSCDAHARQTT